MDGKAWRWVTSSDAWHWVWNISIAAALVLTLVTIGVGLFTWLGSVESPAYVPLLIATITTWVVMFLSFLGALLSTARESASSGTVGSGAFGGGDGFSGGGGGADGGGGGDGGGC